MELTNALTLADPTKMNPYTNPDELSMVQTRSDSTGYMEIHSKFQLGDGWSISPEIFFMNNQVDAGMIQLELMKQWKTCHLAAKTMSGMQYSLSFMQSISESLIAGFEYTYLPERKENMFFYGANYKKGIHDFYFQYLPTGRKEDFNFGYLCKSSPRLTLFSELKGSLEGSSETTGGFRVRFNEAMMTGFLTSNLKATGIYKKTLQNVLSLQLVGSLDLQKTEKPARFGVSLSFGGM